MERVSNDGPITGLSTGTGAVVRKHSGKEPRDVCRSVAADSMGIFEGSCGCGR
jgi:hypothetical protein